MKNYLEGAFDFHLHTGPDAVERKLSDDEMAQRAVARRMAGFIIKNHHEDTSLRADEICRSFPQLHVAGGIVLNHDAGGINAQAVERSAKSGGKLVWFPTLDALHWNRFYNKDYNGKICIVEDGKLIDAVYDVLDVIKQHGLILGTGHISPREALALVAAAHSKGIDKIVLTHADYPSVYTDSSMQLDFVRLGAVIEHASISLEMEKTTWETMVEQVKTVGCGNIVLSSDLGQPQNPYPDDSLNAFVDGLLQRGFTDSEIDLMVRATPSTLLA